MGILRAEDAEGRWGWTTAVSTSEPSVEDTEGSRFFNVGAVLLDDSVEDTGGGLKSFCSWQLFGIEGTVEGTGSFGFGASCNGVYEF